MLLRGARRVFYRYTRMAVKYRYTINMTGTATAAASDDGRRKVNQFNELISPGD